MLLSSFCLDNRLATGQAKRTMPKGTPYGEKIKAGKQTERKTNARFTKILKLSRQVGIKPVWLAQPDRQSEFWPFHFAKFF